jgi:hypothetical protein
VKIQYLALPLAGAAALAIPAASAVTPTHVTNVRFGGHSTYDRMVVDMNGPLPTVSVTKPYSLRTDPADKPVSLQGKGNVQVVLKPTVDAHTGYVGPKKIADLHMKYLHGFQLLGDFEGYVTLGLTTDVTNPKVRTFKLTNPNRVVVDVWK